MVSGERVRVRVRATDRVRVRDRARVRVRDRVGSSSRTSALASRCACTSGGVIRACSVVRVRSR